MNSLEAQLAHMGMRQDAVKLDEVAPPAPADQPAHSLMLQSTDSELAPEVQSNKAKPDETQQPATISEKTTEYLPDSARSGGSKRIKAARIRLAQFARKKDSSLQRLSVKGVDGDERTFMRRKADSDSPSLGDKLRQVVEEAARTKAGDGESAIGLGDELMVFSASAEAWVSGEVVAVTEKEVQVQYSVDGHVRQKWGETVLLSQFVALSVSLTVEGITIAVPLISSELRRNKKTQDAKARSSAAGDDDAGLPTREISDQSVKRVLLPQEKMRAKRVLLRVPESRTRDSIKELVIWTYSCELFHGMSLSQRRKICMEADGVCTKESGVVMRAGDSQCAQELTIMFDGRSVCKMVMLFRFAAPPVPLALKMHHLQIIRSGAKSTTALSRRAKKSLQPAMPSTASFRA